MTTATPRTPPEPAPSGLTLPGATTGEVPDDGRAALAAEVADVLAHLLLLARSQGIDVERAVREKWLVWEADVGRR